MNIESKFYWKILYIWIPLLPFILGGLIRFITIFFSNKFTFDFYNLMKTIYFSWDTVALSFSVTVMAFITKNSLTEQGIILPNSDRINDLNNASLKLFGYGLFNLILFTLLLFIHTRFRDCADKEMMSLHIFFSVIIYLFGFYTIWVINRIPILS